MILVNGIWENTNNLSDISNIIRTHYNQELADKLDELILIHPEQDYATLLELLEEKDNEIQTLQDEIAFGF